MCLTNQVEEKNLNNLLEYEVRFKTILINALRLLAGFCHNLNKDFKVNHIMFCCN